MQNSQLRRQWVSATMSTPLSVQLSSDDDGFGVHRTKATLTAGGNPAAHTGSTLTSDDNTNLHLHGPDKISRLAAAWHLACRQQRVAGCLHQ